MIYCYELKQRENFRKQNYTSDGRVTWLSEKNKNKDRVSNNLVESPIQFGIKRCRFNTQHH